MTPATLLETLSGRGIRLAVLDGDRLGVWPRTAVDDGLRAAIRQAKPGLVALLKRRETELGSRTVDECFCVYSRLLDEQVWLAQTETDADTLEAELNAEGTPALVFTVVEAMAMQGLLAADMRTLARIKRLLPGSRIESVTRRVEAGDA